MRNVVIKVCPICPARRAVAARLVAELNALPEVQAEIARGGLGELSVAIDGRPAYHSRGILVSPSAESVMRRIEDALSAPIPQGG